MERIRALLRKSKSKRVTKGCDEESYSTSEGEGKMKMPKPRKSSKTSNNAPSSKPKEANSKKSKRGKITIVTSKPPFMTDEEFHAFIRRLKYYSLCYMNMKMYVGIDENCITEDTKCVLANIKKAIRKHMKVLKGVDITEDSIVENSKYGTDQIKILKLETILEPIDEMKPMAMAA